MKIANFAAALAFDVGQQADPKDGMLGWLASVANQGVAAIQTANARRRRTANLMNLDERVLSDIGIAEVEIRQLRARRLLLPPTWMD